MSSEQRPGLPVAECERLRDLYDDGLSVGQIVDETSHGKTTVRRHVHDRCTHANENGDYGGSNTKDCPLCGATVKSQNFYHHLPDCPGNEPPEPVATDGGESV